MRQQLVCLRRQLITILLLLLISISTICSSFLIQQYYTKTTTTAFLVSINQQLDFRQNIRITKALPKFTQCEPTTISSSHCDNDSNDSRCSTNDFNTVQFNQNRRNQSDNRIHSITIGERSTTCSRQQFFEHLIPSTIATAAIVTGIISVSVPNTANAAETIGKDPNCNDSTCLGVWDGLLADCPHNDNYNMFSTRAGCVSSQDDTPGIFAEPWDYSETSTTTSSSANLDWQEQMKLLIPSIQIISAKRGDTCTTLVQENRYVRIQFIDRTTNEISIGEFYFTPNDTTVQFRIASTSSGTGTGTSTGTVSISSSLKNIERAEMIRKQIRYLKLPILRNRQRTLLFFENDSMDSFGPGSAALGPPSEMSSNDITGSSGSSTSINRGQQGRLSDTVNPNLKIDLVQSFPTKQ